MPKAIAKRGDTVFLDKPAARPTYNALTDQLGDLFELSILSRSSFAAIAIRLAAQTHDIFPADSEKNLQAKIVRVWNDLHTEGVLKAPVPNVYRDLL